MVTAQCCGRTSGSLNPRPRAYYLFIYLYCGPLRTIAVGGYDGFILGTDDHSRIACVVQMKGKGSEDC